LLAPYLQAVRTFNKPGELRSYPGSPVLAQAFLRKQDRLIACELEPQAAKALRRTLRGDERAKAIEIDGWTALSAYVPPVERRGLVLVDPAFEQEDDFGRLANDLLAAHRKWGSGIYMLWYPIKGRPQPDALAKRLTRLRIPKILRAELTVAPFTDPSKLNGSGLILVNPPWTLEAELTVLLPALADILVRDGGGSSRRNWRLDWLAGEDNR
jgi:23S rRNA (adenine2030-N6)-methyltransferase